MPDDISHRALNRASLLETARALREDRVSSLELTERALRLAAHHEALNIFAHLDADGALEQARGLDAEARAGAFRGALHGIPVSIKDLFQVRDWPTRAGTRAPLPPEFTGLNQMASDDAVVVARLRAAGAVILGKVNLHEIALGVTGENPWTGDVLNPHDQARQAGGSSSGSAVSVATGVAFASLGTDTGGSIRIPASLCGCVGFKPSFGLVPLSGALHLSPTCDHAGPLARSVADARAVFEVLAQHTVSASRALEKAAVRVGVPRDWLEGRLGVAVRAGFEALLERLREAGAVVSDANPPALERAEAAYTPLVRAEAAFVHRRALRANPEGFSESVRGPLELGMKLSAAEYLEARRVRELVRIGLEAMFESGPERVDALILPAAPLPAPKRGTTEVTLESGMSPHRSAFVGLTLPFSLAGLPTLSLPFMRVDGLPVGLQIVGARGTDALVLEIGERFERMIDLEAQS